MVDEAFQLFDEEAPVKISLAAPTMFRIERRSVFVNSVLSRVIDSDDNQRLEFAGVNQPLGGRIHSPFNAAERRGRVKQVLSVVHIQNLVTLGRVSFVS